MLQFIEANEALKPKEIEQVEIQIKYEGYIKKALEKVEKLKRMEAKRIPENIDYAAINGLATEAKQKAEAEYAEFNKIQKITSDFDREVRKMLGSEIVEHKNE